MSADLVVVTTEGGGGGGMDAADQGGCQRLTRPRTPPTKKTPGSQVSAALAYFSLFRAHGGIRSGGRAVTQVPPLGGRDLYGGE